MQRDTLWSSRRGLMTPSYENFTSPESFTPTHTHTLQGCQKLIDFKWKKKSVAATSTPKRTRNVKQMSSNLYRRSPVREINEWRPRRGTFYRRLSRLASRQQGWETFVRQNVEFNSSRQNRCFQGQHLHARRFQGFKVFHAAPLKPDSGYERFRRDSANVLVPQAKNSDEREASLNLARCNS